MEVYALYKKINNVEYRWNTILRFGESWKVIGTVVMKNPGSAAPQEKTTDELSEILRQNYCGQQYAGYSWYRFSPDITMKCIEKLFRGYYGEKMSGVIRIFNLCNVICPDYKELLNKLRNSDDVDNSLAYTTSFDVEQMSAPIYIGWGNAWKKDFKNQYISYFEKACEHERSFFDKNICSNSFHHPLYLMNYGGSKVKDIREKFVESILLHATKSILDNPYNKDASGKGLNIDLLSILSKYAQQRGGYLCPDLTCYAEDTGKSEEYWREYQAWMNDGKPTGIESDEQFYELQRQAYGEILVDLDE